MLEGHLSGDNSRVLACMSKVPEARRSGTPGGVTGLVCFCTVKDVQHPKNFRHDGAETTKLAFREAVISEALSSGNRSR